MTDFITDVPEEVRVSPKGLETVSPGESRGGGFKDAKKVGILVALLVVGGGVVAYQLTRDGGPKTAAAVTPGAPGGAATSVAEVESVLARLDAGPAAEGDELSVERVEALVKRFDTYVQERQVPLALLQANPFEVAVSPGTQEQIATAAKSVADEQARQREEAAQQAAQQAALAKQQRRDALSRLKLGSVLITDSQRLALVDGRIRRVGDEVQGFRIETIEPDRVTLSFDGETADLCLRPVSESTRGQ